MRVPPFLKRGVAIFASISAIGIGLPAASLQAACSATSDSNVRFGVGVQSCDNPRLSNPTDAYNVIVTLDDIGIHPREITVAEGQQQDAHVFFINTGTNTHSATQLPSSPMFNSSAFVTMKKNDFQQGGKGNRIFDSGGIAGDPGASPQQAMIDGAFMIADVGTNGDYVYSSYPDCIAADRPIPSPTNFDCTPAVIHVVDDQISTASLKKALGPGVDNLGTSYTGTVLRPLGDPQCAMLAPDHPFPAPGRPNACVSAIRSKAFATPVKGKKSDPLTGNVTITIDDIKGFDPILAVVATDTTVTFMNKDTNQLVHSVLILNKRMVPSMASAIGGASNTSSGGLAPGQSWSVAFHWVAAGTIAYKPTIDLDQVNNVDPAGNVGPTSLFNGGIQVVCPKGQFTPVSFDTLRGIGQPCSSIAAAQDPAVLTPGTVKDF